MATSVTAVNQFLVCADDLIPPDYISAMSYSLLWSQSVARKENPGSNPSTDAYYMSMTAELNRVAWNVDSADVASFERQGGHFSTGEVVQQILDKYLDEQQKKQVAGVLREIQQPENTAFLKFWLSSSQTTTSTSMAIGTLFEKQGSPAVKVIWYSFETTDTDWQSFFVASDRTSLKVLWRPLEMTLNMTLWNEFKDDLEAKLASSTKKYIQNLELDI